MPLIHPSDVEQLHTEHGEEFELPDGSVVRGIWGVGNQRVAGAMRAARFRAWFATVDVENVRTGVEVVRLADHAVLHVHDVTPSRFGQTRLVFSLRD